MNIATRKKIVVLGMMTKMPVAGVVWQTVHYLLGLRLLGFDVYYVEEHARTPSMFLETRTDDGAGKAAAFIAGVCRKFDIGPDRWCFHALHEQGGVCHGMSFSQLRAVYREAALIINLHGGTQPLPEHYATDRLLYLETDPVQLQIELYEKQSKTIDFLKPHCAFFTFGENYGNPDCKLPVTDLFRFRRTRQPVLMEFWESFAGTPGPYFTTIGNWEQQWRTVKFKGVAYHWSKHREFLKFLDLPALTGQPIELALASYSNEVKVMLETKGWRVRDAMAFSMDVDAYRDFIFTSRGEWTVAKDQNIRLRSGWFSDRSATYLAAGRPVVTQETGFSNILPSGIGLFGFDGTYDVLAAIDAINSDYDKHSRAARQIAREFFSHDVVLKPMLAEVGL